MRVLSRHWFGALIAFVVGASATPLYAALLVPDYMIIANSSADEGDAFNMQNSEIGAIGPNFSSTGGSVSPPSGNPSFPAGTSGPTEGITLDGDVAITSSDGTLLTSSNSDVHAQNTGPLNAGTQGIDCAGSFDSCTDSGSQINSNINFNQVDPPDFTALAEDNGVQGDIDHSQLLTDLGDIQTAILDSTPTDTFDIFTAIQTDRTDTFASGLHIVDINTDGNALLLEANWIIDGAADTFVIFRVESGQQFSIQSGNLLLSGLIGLNNVLFLVDAFVTQQSFDFDNATFFGISFWDYLGLNSFDNVTNFQNVRGCGQVVNDIVEFSNVSMSGCSFDVSVLNPIPLPAALPLFVTGLGFMGLLGWRRKRKAAAAA